MRLATRLFSTLALALGSVVVLRAQPGSLDASFNPGQSSNDIVTDLALQPDGKILVGGYFTTYAGTPRALLCRVTSTGLHDPSFDIGTGFPPSTSTLNTIVLQPDGKVLVGGNFRWFNGTPCHFIVRLNPDGSLDNTFHTGPGINGTVSSLALQPDGKVVVAGSFNAYNSTPVTGIARLHADGTLDTSFNVPQGGFNGNVGKVVLMPSGKIMACGTFTAYGSTYQSCFSVLNADGTLDTSFVQPGTGFSGTVTDVVVQPDGKLLVCGLFGSYNRNSREGIARLNPDGSLDNSFMGTFWNASNRERMHLLRNGQVLVAGAFSIYDNVTRRNIILLHPTARLDTSFGSTAGLNGGIWDMCIQPDGKILVGGSFTTFGTTGIRYLARLNGNAALPAREAAQPVAWQVYEGTQAGFFHVESEKPLTALRAFDALGRTVGAASSTTIDLRTQPAGVYFIQASWGEAKHTRRVVKE